MGKEMLRWGILSVLLATLSPYCLASDFGQDGEFISWPAMSHAAEAGDPEAQTHLDAENQGRWPQGRAWKDALIADGSCRALEGAGEHRYFDSVDANAPPGEEVRAIMRRAIASGCGEKIADWVAIHQLTGIWPDGTGIPYNAFVDLAQRGDVAAERLACEMGTRPNFRDWALVRFCESAAARGDAEAAYRLGVFLDNQPEDHSARSYTWQVVEPKNAPRGTKIALPHYRRAAELGHAGARARLALLHAMGAGLPRDDAEAARLAGLAAGQGHPEGRMVLGLLMLHGRGGVFDPRQGAKLIEQAARAGNTLAQTTMATLHFRGQQVGRDFVKAHSWMELAKMKTRGWPSVRDSSVLLLEPPIRTEFVARTTLTAQTRLEGLAQAVALRKELAESGEWPLIEEFDARMAATLK